MAETHPEPPPDSILAAGHEPSDIHVRSILFFSVALVVLIASSLGGLALVMKFYTSEERVLGQSRPTLYQDETGQFPEPRLQRNTTYDMTKFRDDEDRGISAYSWVDPKASIARIPIDRALDIVAQRGLPPKDLKPKPTGSDQ